MRHLSSRALCVVKHCHVEEGHYRLAIFSALGSIKESLSVRHCANDEEVKTVEMKWLKEKSTEFYKAEIYALIRKWNIAIERNADYVEK